MKRVKTALIILGITFLASCTNEKIIELPISKKNGYGPFKRIGLRGVATYSENKNNEKTYLKVTGIPENWTDVNIGDIETNIYQSTYQDYLSGTVSKERYESLQKAWDWIPDTLNLSKEPIKCRIAFALGKNSTGELKIIVDSNNNYDLSDDEIFKPINIIFNKNLNIDSLAKNNSIIVKYDQFIRNKIVTVSSPLFIAQMNGPGGLMYNFPQYVTAKLENKMIATSTTGFADLSYHNSSTVLLNDNIEEEEKVNSDDIIHENEYLEVDDKLYKNLGVNLNKNVLVLRELNLPKGQLFSTQIGFRSHLFKGKDFKTQALISIDNLKGKYVLLDFWAVWCGPCIQEIPNLKELYEKIDKSKFEIVGVVGNSQPDKLEKIMSEYSITWPQILSDDKNNITLEYGIQAYPTTFLINPEGTIIAKNLRGEELENRVLSLINEL